MTITMTTWRTNTFCPSSMDLLVLNSALAFFSGILSVLAFSQLIRIHLREKSWTRQKVLHFLIGTSNLGYFIFFVSTHFATCRKWLCWSQACGFVLMAYPKILFLTALLLILSFWVDLCHQANDEEDDDEGNNSQQQQALLESSRDELTSPHANLHRGCCSFQSLNFGSRQKVVIVVVALLFILMISFAVIIWIGAHRNSIDSSLPAQVYEDIIAVATLFLGGALGCYGLLLFLKLKKVRSEIASSEKWKVSVLAVTSLICFTSSALVAILTNLPLYYHWHLKKVYGAKAIVLLILYYLLGSLVPSGIVLWITRELPPAIVNRQKNSRVITFVRQSASSSTTRGQRQPEATSSKDQEIGVTPS